MPPFDVFDIPFTSVLELNQSHSKAPPIGAGVASAASHEENTMSYDEKLAERLRNCLGTNSVVIEKRMFGGLALMLNGHMFCGVIEEDPMVRVGPAEYDAALTQPHVRPMDFTGTASSWLCVRRTRRLRKYFGVREMD